MVRFTFWKIIWGPYREQIGVAQGGQQTRSQLQWCKQETMVAWTSAGFLSLDTIDILGQIILTVWGYPEIVGH